MVIAVNLGLTEIRLPADLTIREREEREERKREEREREKREKEREREHQGAWLLL